LGPQPSSWDADILSECLVLGLRNTTPTPEYTARYGLFPQPALAPKEQGLSPFGALSHFLYSGSATITEGSIDVIVVCLGFVES
jgi:hypothetical protein